MRLLRTRWLYSVGASGFQPDGLSELNKPRATRMHAESPLPSLRDAIDPSRAVLPRDGAVRRHSMCRHPDSSSAAAVVAPLLVCCRAQAVLPAKQGASTCRACRTRHAHATPEFTAQARLGARRSAALVSCNTRQWLPQSLHCLQPSACRHRRHDGRQDLGLQPAARSSARHGRSSACCALAQ